MGTIASAAMALTMIAAFLLAVGGVKLARSGDRGKAALMWVAAAVLVGNVLIWTL